MSRPNMRPLLIVDNHRCISCSALMRKESASTHSRKFKPASAEKPAHTWCMEFNRDIGEVTRSAHPARFSPDDKYSR